MAETELDRRLAALFADEHPSRDDHPGPGELLAYVEDSLAPQETRKVQDHLEGCRECVGAVLDLETLARPEAPPAGGAVDFELAGAWRTFKTRRGGALAAGEGRPIRRRFRYLEAAAAVFFVSTLALSFWVARLHDSLEARDEPQLNVPVLYLDSTRADGTAAGRLELPPEADAFLLFLMPADPRDFESYEVEILGPEDRPVWSGSGLEMSDGGSLRIGISRRFLPEGDYRVRLFGRSDGDLERIDDYRLEIGSAVTSEDLR